MKKTGLFRIIVFISMSIFSEVTAQNWAPFNPLRKIVFSCPDSISETFYTNSKKYKGHSLVLFRIDSISHVGGNSSFSCTDCTIPFHFSDPGSYFSSSTKGVTLFGSSMSKEGKNYFFSNGDRQLRYFSEAEVGDTVLKAQDWVGIVGLKQKEGSDSIKQVSFRSTGINPISFVLRLSKERGFLDFPDILVSNPNYPNIYHWFKDFDEDFKGIKSFKGENKRFRVGDRLSNYDFVDKRYSSNLVSQVSKWAKSKVISVMGDSCIIEDSVRKIDVVTQQDSVIYRVKKVLNRTDPNLGPVDLDGFLSSALSSFESKIAFITTDSILYIGYIRQYFEGGQLTLRNPLYPFYIHKESIGGMGGNLFSNILSMPLYFQRGDTILGQQINVNFTENKKLVGQSVQVYPNPMLDKFQINTEHAGPFAYWISDIRGVKVCKGYDNGSGKTEVSVERIPSGIFFLSIQFASGERVIKKIIKE